MKLDELKASYEAQLAEKDKEIKRLKQLFVDAAGWLRLLDDDIENNPGEIGKLVKEARKIDDELHLK